jgi:hypothetical protein
MIANQVPQFLWNLIMDELFIEIAIQSTAANA